ncbi:hypothetical protein MHYP_G00148820 [Metynnis hypsauchen]
MVATLGVVKPTAGRAVTLLRVRASRTGAQDVARGTAVQTESIGQTALSLLRGKTGKFALHRFVNLGILSRRSVNTARMAHLTHPPRGPPHGHTEWTSSLHPPGHLTTWRLAESLEKLASAEDQPLSLRPMLQEKVTAMK